MSLTEKLKPIIEHIIYIYKYIYKLNKYNKMRNVNDQFENENKVNVKASDIIKIFSSPVNRHSFAIENSK